MLTIVVAEEIQEIGRKGVYEIKEWLESTVRFQFSYTVYDRREQCSVTCLDGSHKALDMVGKTLDGREAPVNVECKKYSSASGQTAEFRKFLAIAYSSTAHSIKEFGSDPEREFMWVTFHPFAQGKWKKLGKPSYLRECIEEHKTLLNGTSIDDDLLSVVASRLWLLVVHKRQMSLRLSESELAHVKAALTEKGKK